jgi:hypothetical protein
VLTNCDAFEQFPPGVQRTGLADAATWLGRFDGPVRLM